MGTIGTLSSQKRRYLDARYVSRRLLLQLPRPTPQFAPQTVCRYSWLPLGSAHPWKCFLRPGFYIYPLQLIDRYLTRNHARYIGNKLYTLWYLIGCKMLPAMIDDRL